MGLSLSAFLSCPSLGNAAWLGADLIGFLLPIIPALGFVRWGDDLFAGARQLSRAERLLRPGGRLIGTAGTSSRIRQVTGGRAAAQRLSSRVLGGGAERVTAAGSRVQRFRLAEGGEVSFRTFGAQEGVEATIEVFIEGIGIDKIKFLP